MGYSLPQRCLLGLYEWARRLGFVESRLGRSLFLAAYDLYKSWFEAGAADLLGHYIPDGALVFDVGANVGFFTARFARMVGAAGRVIAIEPESRNAADLDRSLTRQGLRDRVEIVAAVAAEREGMMSLVLNPSHPADHKIGDQGVPVRAVTLDGLVRLAGKSPALIKIDVQGAEPRVLDGAAETIRLHRPALYIELHDPSLAAMGSSVEALLDRLSAAGYQPHRLDRKGAEALTREQTLAWCKAPPGYQDVLFLPHPGTAS
jgi:FkbM family methyltransferase